MTLSMKKFLRDWDTRRASPSLRQFLRNHFQGLNIGLLEAQRRVTVMKKHLATVKTLMRFPTDRDEEAKILRLIQGLDPVQLNQLLTRINLSRLFNALEDHLTGADNRTALFDLLTRRRLGQLGVNTRLALVNTFQKGKTGEQEEKALQAIFLSTRGADLTALKNGIDLGGDYRDLQQLLHSDIDDNKIRKRILAHIKQESEGTSLSAVKALSDIDDTFYANFIDQRYPKGTVYPGVLDYYQELLQGPSPSSSLRGNLVFLTARPKDRTGIIEEYTQNALQQKGAPGTFTILSGDFISLVSNTQIAEKKFENFVQYRQLFPEYGFVFTGDSGQGDALFGKKLQATFKKDVRGIFIHDVVSTPPAEREKFKRQGVIFFDTYVGAAVEALKAKLISKEGLQRIIERTQKALKAVRFKDSRKRVQREADLNKDIDRALKLF